MKRPWRQAPSVTAPWHAPVNFGFGKLANSGVLPGSPAVLQLDFEVRGGLCHRLRGSLDSGDRRLSGERGRSFDLATPGASQCRLRHRRLVPVGLRHFTPAGPPSLIDLPGRIAASKAGPAGTG